MGPLRRCGCRGLHDVGDELVAGGVAAEAVVVELVEAVVVLLQPGVPEHVLRGEPLRGVPPQQRPDEAARPRAQPVRHHVVAAADLGEQRGVLRVVERVPSHERGVEDDPQAPHVSRPARVLGVAAQDLGADVRRAPPLVLKQVVLGRIQNHGVLQRLQLQRRPLPVGEDELAQLEVAQHDAVLVAVPHALGHLAEQAARLRLPQPPPGAHVRVQVAVCRREDEVRVLRVQHHLAHAVERRVPVHAEVRRQQRPRLAAYHLTNKLLPRVDVDAVEEGAAVHLVQQHVLVGHKRDGGYARGAGRGGGVSTDGRQGVGVGDDGGLGAGRHPCGAARGRHGRERGQ